MTLAIQECVVSRAQGIALELTVSADLLQKPSSVASMVSGASGLPAIPAPGSMPSLIFMGTHMYVSYTEVYTYIHIHENF